MQQNLFKGGGGTCAPGALLALPCKVMIAKKKKDNIIQGYFLLCTNSLRKYFTHLLGALFLVRLLGFILGKYSD